MRKLSLICLMALVISVFAACQATNEESAKSSNTDTGVQYEYRAVCTEKEAHGGNEQVLTRWLDKRSKAEDYGREHGDFKYKGHQWKIEERIKTDEEQP